MSDNINREDLIKGTDMENALQSAAEIKMNILTTYKEQDKSNLDQFYETVLNSRVDIQEILGKKKKNRTDAENQILKEFKRNTVKSYKLVSDFLVPEDIEDGKPNKAQKIVERFALIFDYLKYIGNHDLESALQKYGITVTSPDLKNKSDVWADDRINENIKNVFNAGKKVREHIKDDTQHIVEDIFTINVPSDLVYEKNTNPVGLKKSDWTKLVAIKTKMLMAKVDEQKEKADDQANELAAEKQFDQERARLMQAKLITMESEKDSDK